MYLEVLGGEVEFAPLKAQLGAGYNEIPIAMHGAHSKLSHPLQQSPPGYLSPHLAEQNVL
jgi:hypothetical protein